MKFRKKPVIIDAVQWFGYGDHPSVVCYSPSNEFMGDQYPAIQTLEGWMRVSTGDWIITGVKGEMYPCKPDIFQATYEPVDEILRDPSNVELSV